MIERLILFPSRQGFLSRKTLSLDRLVCATLYDSLISGLGSKKIPDVALLRRHLLIEGTVTKECLMHLLKEVTTIFRK